MTTANASRTLIEAVGAANAAAAASRVLQEVVALNGGAPAAASRVLMEVVYPYLDSLTVVNYGTLLPAPYGGAAPIFANVLSASAVGASADEIQYVISSGPTLGHFTLSGTTVTTFTQGDIDRGLLQYVVPTDAYRYGYRSPSILDTSANGIVTESVVEPTSYTESGGTTTTDSFSFTFDSNMFATITPAVPLTFDLLVINDGCVRDGTADGTSLTFSYPAQQSETATVLTIAETFPRTGD